VVGILAILGSGENSPAMVTTHQKILSKYGKESKRILLDTPAGFQENSKIIAEKINNYLELNVGFPAELILLENLTPSDYPKIKSEITQADWVFAGPGSPTYALRKWQEMDLLGAFLELLEHGALVLSSAAAMPMGKYVLPVYEIYKVGEDPHWKTGLNLFEKIFGLPTVIIPHFNNNQGGNHDTSYCFVGEKRFQQIAPQLEAGTLIIGIDEHTAAVFDLAAQTVEVSGKGNLTIIKNGQVRKFKSKTILPLADLFS
jgi:cyanophycinase-like exopeptidase